MPAASRLDVVQAWAASGAMALCGRAEGAALGPPAPLVDGLLEVGSRIEAGSAALGTPVELDWLALLGERAALAGLHRAGTTSCGGSTRLLAAADGWMAVCLARPEDVELLPAWLGVDDQVADPWSAVTVALAGRRCDELVAGASLLGLPVAALGERVGDGGDGVLAADLAAAPPVGSLADVLVVDCSGLWAGPLCASLLGLAGARVVKVESVARPDGARRTSDGFFDLLNAGKRSVAVDLATTAGRDALRRLIWAADVVVESARPRALEQLGVVAADAVTAGSVRAWVSITGHGRAAGRVAFGDDAAVAGGLVVTDADGPCFCADAVADPATGLVAAAAALDALAGGGRWLLDVGMAGVSARLAGPTLPAGGVDAAPPRARSARGTARSLGADTAAVLAEL